jgi:hypothetical protein
MQMQRLRHPDADEKAQQTKDISTQDFGFTTTLKVKRRTWPLESVSARAPLFRLSFQPSKTATIWLKNTGRSFEPRRSILT